MFVFIVGVSIILFVLLFARSYLLGKQDVDRWEKYPDLREKYLPLLNKTKTSQEYDRLWEEFEQECIKREER